MLLPHTTVHTKTASFLDINHIFFGVLSCKVSNLCIARTWSVLIKVFVVYDSCQVKLVFSVEVSLCCYGCYDLEAVILLGSYGS